MPEDAYTGSQIDHLNLAVPDLERSVAFYAAALAPLGIITTMTVNRPDSGAFNVTQEDVPPMHSFGVDRKPFFWLIEGGTVGSNMHLAFTARDRQMVRDFYAAALAAGASSRLEPAVHEEYHPGYYGAFVNDPDGINLEAVCHLPE